ncbi:MAG: 1-(5-phosphoribosyl)-5-[(5-phosphoribosylamino)methylideneamino]imidazole-4-carboxamide isomerase [Nitrospirae bacterium]|nr:1-(5-phosphoribosyl)-5-[(5-phosphoribosylamino)methylideneamino]imidazole-4-carboxamide isomerase [Nitrospirota bacterium]
MLIIPAIDLKDGHCVRLIQGRKDDVTVYSYDPVATALRWESLGAKLIHIVDLDGAFTGSQKNLESIIAIRKAVKAELEVGGGIRDLNTIKELISFGIERVILGTSTIENPALIEEASKAYPGNVLVGLDARDGMVAVKGWVEATSKRAVEVAIRMASLGAGGIIYTDISRDGMLTGPNISAVREIVSAVEIPVIASGGVSSLNDIRKLMEVNGLWGVITGKAIYEGNLDLKEAIRLTEGS